MVEIQRFVSALDYAPCSSFNAGCFWLSVDYGFVADPESRTAVDTDGDTGGARSPVAPFEIAADRRGGTTPAPAVLSLVARSTSVLATRGDKHDPLASSQAAGDTCASSRAHAVPPSPSLPGSHVTHGTDSSTPVPPHGYTRGLSSRVRDQDQNYSLSPDTNTGPTRVRQLLDRILRGKRQIESETREAVVLGRTSVTPARAPRQHPLSTAKRVSFCLPDQPEPDTPREAIDNFASVVPQKRKHAGLRDDVHTRDGPRTTSSRRSRSGSADVGSEDTSGAFAKRRKVLDFARPAGGAVENVDEAEESDEADEAEADDEWESGTGHRMVTRRAAGKTTSTPPSREIIPEEAQPKKPVTVR
ncbi:hypothetical protein DENSPDRAFT_235007 [Dentipellis sp. KUC8613]|nr:hypothetical protein DENSPDRAFT_235007 [Dentipellis sp. KUC8613]